MALLFWFLIFLNNYSDFKLDMLISLFLNRINKLHYTEWFGWPVKSSYSVPHSFHRQSAEFLGRRKNIGRWKSEFNPWIVDVLKHIKLWDLNLNHNGYVGWNSMWKKNTKRSRIFIIYWSTSVSRQLSGWSVLQTPENHS